MQVGNSQWFSFVCLFFGNRTKKKNNQVNTFFFFFLFYSPFNLGSPNSEMPDDYSFQPVILALPLNLTYADESYNETSQAFHQETWVTGFDLAAHQ